MIDVIIISILAIIVFMIVRGWIKNKANGISSGCGCGCSSCSMAGQCRGKDNNLTSKDTL